jgi:phage terminase large subunit
MTYSYKTDPLTDRILPVLEDKNNHIMDALRYACEGIRQVREKKKPKKNIYASYGSWM